MYLRWKKNIKDLINEKKKKHINENGLFTVNDANQKLEL